MAEAEMSDLQIIVVAFFAIGLLAFFFGEALPITLLLGWLTWQWITDQPDRPYAIVQAGLAWSMVIVLNQVYIQGIRAARRLAWRRRIAEIAQARARIERAGLNWDYEMSKARARFDEREKMYWNVGLSNRHDREAYFSERGDY